MQDLSSADTESFPHGTLQNKVKTTFSLSSETYNQAAILQRQVADNLFDYIMQQQLNPKQPHRLPLVLLMGLQR